MNITPIIEAVLTLLGLIITAVLVPYIRSKTTANQRATIQFWVDVAVYAIEQLYPGKGNGEEKKNRVLNWLDDHNLTYDLGQVDKMIEATVKKMNIAQDKPKAEV